MPKLRKRPKPADAEPVKNVQAQVEPAPAVPPPVVEHKPPVALDAMILCPRSPEDVIHNVILRQIEDELKNPPPREPENPALALLRKVQDAKDQGKPLTEFAEEATRIFQGLDAEEKLTETVVRQFRLRCIRREMESDEYLDAFLHRCLKRGDLSPREAIILKQQNVNALMQNVKELLMRLEKGESQVFSAEDMSRMDWTLQMVEKTSTHPFEQMTPIGREIVRKITIRARRKLFPANVQ